MYDFLIEIYLNDVTEVGAKHHWSLDLDRKGRIEIKVIIIIYDSDQKKWITTSLIPLVDIIWSKAKNIDHRKI